MGTTELSSPAGGYVFLMARTIDNVDLMALAMLKGNSANRDIFLKALVIDKVTPLPTASV
ncbi:hypothetical protein PM082_006712 [Marasmius tenuissimus]|nr:hypothetical protein PM082_006712 [Marasmius tenuissimus]